MPLIIPTGLLFGGEIDLSARDAQFDGTNDWLSRGADLTGIVNGKVGTVSFWIKSGADAQNNEIIVNQNLSGASTGRFRIKLAGNKIEIAGKNTGATEILKIESSANSVQVADGWVHVMASWDLATSAEHLYINGVSDITVTTSTNDNIDYTSTTPDWGIGSEPDGTGGRLNAGLAQFYLNTAEYVDLSNAENRTFFYNANNTGSSPSGAVDMDADGSSPTGSQPIIFLNNPLATWHTNLGSGGGFTENGALTDAT